VLGDDMSTDIIDHTTLAKMAEAGIALTANAVRSDNGWVVLIRYGTDERALAADRSHPPRVFSKLDTVSEHLKSLGVLRFEVDASDRDLGSRRDKKAALAGAKAAAAYSRWLKAEIQLALDDTHAVVAHDKAMRQVRTGIKADAL
jgi:hypothetical protein